MEGAPDTVVRHIGNLESLLVDALTRQSRVTMNLNTERRSAHSGIKYYFRSEVQVSEVLPLVPHVTAVLPAGS